MKYNVVFCCFIAVDVGVVIVVFDVDVGVGIRFFLYVCREHEVVGIVLLQTCIFSVKPYFCNQY